MSGHNIHFQDKILEISTYPKYINICSYGKKILGTQDRVRNSGRKRALGVRAIACLLHVVFMTASSL